MNRTIYPTIVETVVLADDYKLAAMLSCILAERDRYVPVLDGPRMTRPDREAEVIRRHNAIARARAKRVTIAGLPDDAVEAVTTILPDGLALAVVTDDWLSGVVDDTVPRLEWGADNIAVGVLRAQREGKLIAFRDGAPTQTSITGVSGHLVVVEAGEPLSEVIAANYAFAIGAGVCVIPPIERSVADDLLEQYYRVDDPGVIPTELLQSVRDQLRQICAEMPVPRDGSITFIARHLPLGIGFPEVPSTHLFQYPDLGISVINGLAESRRGPQPVNLAVLVDPGATDAPDVDVADRLLRERSVVIRPYRGSSATVRAVSDMVELLPYDLLLFATHCGDAEGSRWTYEYRDSEGIDRTLVVDIAVGLATTSDPEMLEVSKYVRFHSLDGVDWNDRAAKAQLHVGTAITDYVERARGPDEMEPTLKEPLARVKGSAVLRMADANYMVLPRTLACEGNPIVINNACWSWHELAGRMTFSNARAYVGTLFPISGVEAEEVTRRLFGEHFGKPIAHAIWLAQNEIYGDGVRRPYVVTGVYPQRMQVTREDVPARVLAQLKAARSAWASRRDKFKQKGMSRLADQLEHRVQWCERELVLAEEWAARQRA